MGFSSRRGAVVRSQASPSCLLRPKDLLERGLMRLETGLPFPRLFFTDAGLEELRAMMRDRRLADPVKFAHVRAELGIDASAEPTSAGR